LFINFASKKYELIQYHKNIRMKKLTYLAGAALGLAMAACSGTNTQVNDLPGVSAAQADTVIQAYAYAVGAQNGQRAEMFIKQDSTLNKEQMLLGMQYLLNADTTQSYVYGLQIGQQVLMQIKYLESMGLKVDRNKFINEFKRAFLADSLNQEAVNYARIQFENGMNTIRTARKAYEDSVKSNSPEALVNTEKGKKYLQSVMKADSAVKVTESGLGYKIENAGGEKKVAEQDRIGFRYTGKTIDGKVFDKTGEEPSSMIVNQLVAGMQEGLKMLGEGGKATFYIPGKLAYGPDGVSQIGIGPNEMLVFDVEVTSVGPVVAYGRSVNR